MTPIIWPGCRVLNTRPLEQAEKLNQWITNAGGIPISCPMLTIQPIPYTEWQSLLPNLNDIHQAIFTSSHAVKYFFSARDTMNQSLHISWPSSIQIIAIGSATAATLAEYGFANVTIPAISTSEHLINLPSLKHIENQFIVLIKGKEGRTYIAEALQERQAHLICLDVYQRQKPLIAKKYLHRLWQENGIDVIILTSNDAMQNLVALLDNQALPWLRSKPCLVISQRLAECAKEIGMQHITICNILSTNSTTL